MHTTSVHTAYITRRLRSCRVQYKVCMYVSTVVCMFQLPNTGYMTGGYAPSYQEESNPFIIPCASIHAMCVSTYSPHSVHDRRLSSITYYKISHEAMLHRLCYNCYLYVPTSNYPILGTTQYMTRGYAPSFLQVSNPFIIPCACIHTMCFPTPFLRHITRLTPR